MALCDMCCKETKHPLQLKIFPIMNKSFILCNKCRHKR